MIPDNFSEYFKSLDRSNRQEIVNELMLMISPSNEDTASLLSRVGDKSLTCCPNCKGNDIRANGKYKGIQRYYCKECKKYFRNTTGKVVFGLKKPELFSTYLYNMLMGYSIKKCAEQTKVCVQTSFDWRHKVLSAFEQACPEGFAGITESDDIFFLDQVKVVENLRVNHTSEAVEQLNEELVMSKSLLLLLVTERITKNLE